MHTFGAAFNAAFGAATARRGRHGCLATLRVFSFGAATGGGAIAAHERWHCSIPNDSEEAAASANAASPKKQLEKQKKLEKKITNQKKM